MEAHAVRHLSQDICARIWAVSDDPCDRESVSGIFKHIPSCFHHKLLREYETLYRTQGQRPANLHMIGVKELFQAHGLNYAADDDEIVQMAKKGAKEVRAVLQHGASENTLRGELARIAERNAITLPNCTELSQIVARMTAEKWWRSRLRKHFRKIEHAAIHAGFVHRRDGLYVTDEWTKRRQAQKRKNARLLENMEAINEVGDTFTLAELSAKNVSNPTIRRAELMTRVRGTEEYSKLIGHIGLLLTITTPSRFHARHYESCEQNTNYDGTRPDRAQGYLLKKVWAPAQAKLQRDGIEYFGLRVVEPHHDGTPHWHMLAFVNPDHADALITTLRDYALAESPDEPGAQDRRFTAIRIDPAKGTGSGYVSKYIGKNIDGKHVGTDYEGECTATESAKRVEAWASLWRIRQFQFFGTPSVTPWRELRRLDAVPETMEATFGPLWRAADLGDWCAFMKVQREGATRLKPLWEDRDSASYPGEMVKRVRGVETKARNASMVTRNHEWTIQEKEGSKQARLERQKAVPRRGVDLPWTRVNNSTGTVKYDYSSEETLTYDPRNGPRFDIGGLGFWKCQDGTVICIPSAGYEVGSFGKTDGKNGVSPPGMAAKTHREAGRVGGRLE
jgi:hypothetical protein